ncbi:DUF2288 domain-containing protein [Pseudomonas oryzihabitans]|uniref:DUF2288 domain-containing protein n=1 Tax=Pseudomonas oryzihabitans TaxID=47885 RepID=UPI00289FEF76|nr:DUF2288 domain-containing protein [Pseudomonas oryzihabitans]
MTDHATRYATLLGQTAAIGWEELQPHFARGVLLEVVPELDLIEAAIAVTQDDAARVGQWLQQGQLAKVDEERARRRLEAPEVALWAVVVAPWVLMQERPAERAAD